MGILCTISGKIRLDRKLAPNLVEKINELRSGDSNWVVTEDHRHIDWEGSNYRIDHEWLEYIIEKILKPNQYVANGMFICETDYEDLECYRIRDNSLEVIEVLPCLRGR